VSLRAGDIVEHFVIVSLLGEGGMGQVYLARDTRLQRSVALKIMQPPAGVESGAPASGSPAARLLREAQAAAGLEHPNVVTIYEVGEIHGAGEEDSRPFIAMELVKGKSLRQLVSEATAPMKERIRWLTDVARGLAAAHRAGFLHRDIKPENVMVRDDGVVKVLDFGLAKRASPMSASLSSSTEAQVLPSLTGEGVAIGTPYYMAPEQMRREALDGRADQFAWAVVAYEVLSGEPTWGRDVDALELVSKLLSHDPTPLGELRPDVPPHVAAAVMRALSKRRGARFETMDDLVAALEDTSGALDPTMPKIPVSVPDVSAAANEPAAAPPARVQKTAASVRPPPPRGRGRVVAIAGGAAVVAAIAVAFVAMSRRAAPTSATVASASASEAPRECSRNSECVTKMGGKPAVCNPRGSCAVIESEDCRVRADPAALASDDTVWIGELYPLTGPEAVDGVDNERGTDLGRQDFAQVGPALRSAARKARPLALVACDDAADARRAARHLVEDVGVPAIIGFGNGAELIDLGGSLLAQHQVLAVATMTTNPFVTQLPRANGEPPLVWRTTYSSVYAARALARVVASSLEPALRVQAVSRTRVALISVKSTGAQAFSEALFDALHFNGKTALDNGADYQSVAFDPAAPDAEERYASAVARLRELAPHVVVYTGGEPVVDHVIAPLERSWPSSQGVRPYYLSMTVIPDAVFGIVGHSRELRRRFLGVTLPSTTPVNGRFTVHYNETYGKTISRADAPSTAYDGFYLVAYAVMALDGAVPDGRGLARAIDRLVGPGASVDVGPTGILPAFAHLRASESIDLNGAAGNLDFDRKTGEHVADLSVLCVDVDRRGSAVDNIESGVRYDARADALVGDSRCP
jgi:serine/threonine protein kinase/ABC-type branched-subunit amino acid transport system substrate-binding protein